MNEMAVRSYGMKIEFIANSAEEVKLAAEFLEKVAALRAKAEAEHAKMLRRHDQEGLGAFGNQIIAGGGFDS